MFWLIVGLTVAILVVETVAIAWVVRRKCLDRWLAGYLFGMNLCPRLNHPQIPETNVSGIEPVAGHQTPWERFRHDEPLCVFVAVCDHFEPDNASAPRHVADARLNRWCDEYPRTMAGLEDCRGRVPQHTFFYPGDEYFVPGYLDRLKTLCEAGFGDVEIHLHHDGDSADSLREKLAGFRDTLHQRHGLLRRDPVTQQISYGFIHGNWALCNSRSDGRWCGVNDELTILRETGCFADFTMPSAPEGTQTGIINSIYYSASSAARPKSHDRGTRATLGVTPPRNHLLLVQGPLTFNWQNRTRGIMPRIENGDLIATNAPTWDRFEHWLRCGVHVAGRPDWCFVKLHTHGCKDGNIDMLLGEPYRRFHESLRHSTATRNNLRVHYVTAWEMAQLVKQAEWGVRSPEFGTALA